MNAKMHHKDRKGDKFIPRCNPRKKGLLMTVIWSKVTCHKCLKKRYL